MLAATKAGSVAACCVAAFCVDFRQIQHGGPLLGKKVISPVPVLTVQSRAHRHNEPLAVTGCISHASIALVRQCLPLSPSCLSYVHFPN